MVTGFRAHHSAFRTCAEKVAQLLGIDVAMPTMETRGGRRIAAALRKPLLERGATIVTREHRGPWDDIGSVAAYLQANARWLRASGLDTFRGEGAHADDAHASVIGAGARATGRLERVVLWPGARAVGPLADAVVTTSGLVVRAAP